MPKSPKLKKQPGQPNIHVEGDVIGDNIVIGSNNTINFQEALKTTYGLFTVPPPVTDFTGREAELEQHWRVNWRMRLPRISPTLK